VLNPNEEWRDVINFEGYYEISSIGRVRNARTQKIKAQNIQSNEKYMYVQLWKNNKHYTDRVHRLVAEAFIPNLLNKPQVNHINKDDKDNRVINLEWVTSSENHLHSYKHGRINSKSRLGEKTSNASQYRYTYWDSNRSLWKSSIKFDGKTYNVGRYDNELSAAVEADAYIDRMGWNRQKNFS